MVYCDAKHIRAFKRAIFEICGSRKPSPACRADIGARAAKLAGHSRPWTAHHLFVCMNLERYLHHNNGRVKYGISHSLFDAVLKLANVEALQGRRRVSVYARGVREGAVILGRSRKCAWRKCRVHFVGDAHRKYCSEQCGNLAHADLKKRSTRERRERARRLAARRRSEKRRAR